MPATDLVHRAGVELVNTGSWKLLSGSWDPNRDDILAAVEAAKCPAVRRPRLKLGHLDPRFNEPDDKTFDGTPALGWFDNLRASADGNTLLGDQVALPWLDRVQAAAWPDRSIEGTYRKRCALGHVHPFVIDAVSLLGETPPGIPTLKSIKSLADLPEALGVAAAGDVPDSGEHVQATIRAAAEVHTGAMIALIPTAEDAARLAVDGGEPAEELHVTLAYLGKAADLGPRGIQDVIDRVSTAANGLPHLEGEIFAPSVFNPGDANDRDTCLTWLVSGDIIDAVHDLIIDALELVEVPLPSQHRPWAAHISAAYTDDLGRLAELSTKVGPVRFDRLRLAFGGEWTDIPLMEWPGEEPDTPEAVAASALAQWRGRIAASAAPPGTAVPASPESQIPTPPTPGGVFHAPAAEPAPSTTEEDMVSLDPDVRQRLGLADDADKTAVLAAIDELKTKADTPAEPSPEAVAASAANTEKRVELEKEVAALTSRMQEVTAELAATKAEKVETVKASVLDAALKDGKIKPADKDQWSKDYDEAPGVTTRVLASIAPGTAVPVMASGHTGPAEPDALDPDAISDAELNAWASQLGVDPKELANG
jgi:hypothetical protein